MTFPILVRPPTLVRGGCGICYVVHDRLSHGPPSPVRFFGRVFTPGLTPARSGTMCSNDEDPALPSWGSEPNKSGSSHVVILDEDDVSSRSRHRAAQGSATPDSSGRPARRLILWPYEARALERYVPYEVCF